MPVLNRVEYQVKLEASCLQLYFVHVENQVEWKASCIPLNTVDQVGNPVEVGTSCPHFYLV